MEMEQSLEYDQSLALDTFTSFPKLLPELRLKIWAFTIRRRILTIESYPGVLENGIRIPPYLFKARVPWQPALLHVNFESRQVALQHYELAFKSLLSNGPVYFNDQLDGLHLKDRLSRGFFWDAILHDEEAKARIQVLVMEDVFYMVLARMFNQFSGVKEIFRHEKRPWQPRMSLEVRFRKKWNNVKGEDERQLVVKFLSNASLQEMIEVIEALNFSIRILLTL
jgi:hypothetical protein